MFQGYRFKLVNTALFVAALIAYAMGGKLGVMMGYIGGPLFVYLNDPVRKKFQTDAERVLESLTTPEEKIRQLRLVLQTILFSLAAGFVVEELISTALGAAGGAIVALMVTILLVRKFLF